MLSIPRPSSGIPIRQAQINLDLLRIAPYAPASILTMDVEGIDRLVSLSEKSNSIAGEVVVRPYLDHYEVLLGARYIEAYKKIKSGGDVLITVCHYSDKEAVNIAISFSAKHHKIPVVDLVEPYTAAINHFGWKNAELARALNIKPSTLTNRMHLRNLDPQVIYEMKHSAALTLEHMKILCKLPKKEQRRLALGVIRKGMTSRQLYKAVNPEWIPDSKMLADLENNHQEVSAGSDGEFESLETAIGEQLGCPTAIRLDATKNHEGTINLTFHTMREAAGIISKLYRGSQSDRCGGVISISIGDLEMFNAIYADIIPDDDF